MASQTLLPLSHWVCSGRIEMLIILLPVLQKFDPQSQQTTFACLEIHVGVRKNDGDSEGDGGKKMYRVFSHQGVLERKDSKV